MDGECWREEDDTSEALPTGTVTFVLGDVVGSTALWELRPEAATEMFATLDGLIAKLVDRHGGVKPIEQGEGDSFVGAFAHAIDAATFAVELQRSIATEPWSKEASPRLRLGVHTGDARLQDGLYRGEVLNRCARIRSLAYGGQILVSSATSEVVVDHLTHRMFLKDLGLHRLRDLSRAEHLRQLCHPGLLFDFPALQSLDNLPNNLPLQLTSFIGRDAEVADVGELLASTRLVTLTGAGGCGKTRLAIQVAAAALDHYPDGTWLADLSAVNDPALVARSIASLFGVREMPFEDAATALTRYLQDRHTLVVVDNCEHLLDACATVIRELTTTCAGVYVLTTSREPLGIAGETTYRVPSLALPEPDAPQCTAVELFTARAVAVRPSFVLSGENLDAVASICRRLDGLPLAIELAAARCRALSPQQIAAQLAERFSLLSGGTRTALPRQRTLEASVGWSIDLLGGDERTLLRRISVFAGSFALEAAEAVGAFGSDDAWRVVDLLTSLVDKSLVQVEEHEDRVRYRLLETIRHFASQQLLAANEAAMAHATHADYFVRFVRETAVGLVGPQVAECYNALDAEIENIRRSLAWLVDAERVDPALELAGSLYVFWTRVASPDVLRSLESILALDGGDPATRARVIIGAVEVAWILGDLTRNAQLLDDADQLAETIGDPTLSLLIGLMRGYRGMLTGDSDADDRLRRAADGMREVGEHYWSSDALFGLGTTSLMRGDLAASAEFLTQAVADARKSRNPVALSRSLVLQCSTLMRRGQLEEAERALREGELLQGSAADESIELFAECYRAWIDMVRGQHDEGYRRSMRVIDNARRTGLVMSLHGGLSGAVLAQYGAARFTETQALLDDAETAAAAVGSQWGAALYGAVRAELTLAAGDCSTALTIIDSALRIAEEQPLAGIARSQCMLTRARVLRAAGDEGAEDEAHRALATGVEGELRLETIEALELLALLAAESNAAAHGARLAGAAGRARADIGCPVPPNLKPEADRTRELLEQALEQDELDQFLDEGANLDIDAAYAYVTRGRGARRRPSVGWSSLTPSECQVVELIAEGLKNADIAQRLFVTVPTVKTHLAHIFTKLGVSTRSELAAQASRRGLRQHLDGDGGRI